MKTTGDWIRTFQQYPPDTIMVFLGPAITFDTPDGEQATPLFRWPDDPLSIKVGDRVRKPGYDDIGIVTDVQLRKGYNAVWVKWDNTGQSNENSNLLGLAVE